MYGRPDSAVPLGSALDRRGTARVPGASLEELDRRVPFSITQWHQHVNWCVPARGQKERWSETREGRPVFGPRSPIPDESACAAVGGRFLPRIFGWMVHVNAFASDD